MSSYIMQLILFLLIQVNIESYVTVSHQLAYRNTPLISISNVAALTRGMAGSILPLPTMTRLPPGLVDCNTNNLCMYISPTQQKLH